VAYDQLRLILGSREPAHIEPHSRGGRLKTAEQHGLLDQHHRELRQTQAELLHVNPESAHRKDVHVAADAHTAERWGPIRFCVESCTNGDIALPLAVVVCNACTQS
jgi:hypothetical protein